MKAEVVTRTQAGHSGAALLYGLLRGLSGQPVDRPPMVCSGGMVNAAITEVTSSAVGVEDPFETTRSTLTR